MGAIYSKPQDLNTPAVEEQVNFFDTVTNNLRRLRDGAAALATDHLTTVLDEVDLEMWSSKVELKNQLVREVHSFTTDLELDIQVVHDRLLSPNFNNFQECYSAFDADYHIQQSRDLSRQCVVLQTQFQTFAAKLAHKYHHDKERIMRIAGSVTFALVGAGLATLLLLHIIPNVPFCLSTGFLCGVGTTTGLSTIGAITGLVTKSHVEQTIDKLATMSSQVGGLSLSLNALKSCTRKLTVLQKQECIKLTRKIIVACSEVIKTCESVMKM